MGTGGQVGAGKDSVLLEMREVWGKGAIKEGKGIYGTKF